eukprot:765798-Pelagomonas_calceolata.AAC.4
MHCIHIRIGQPYKSKDTLFQRETATTPLKHLTLSVEKKQPFARRLSGSCIILVLPSRLLATRAPGNTPAFRPGGNEGSS